MRLVFPDAHPFDDGVTLASFDVFDTALVRPCARPEDLHELVGEQLAIRNLIPCSGAAWREERVRAERAARVGKRGREVTLREIYRVLGDRMGLDEPQTARAMEIEIEAELEALNRVASTHSLISDYRRRGCKIAFVSDMYLPREVIERALLDHQLMAPGDLLLVSSDSGVRKRDGRLFEHLVDVTGIPGDRIGHTGDNRTSDVAAAKILGLRAAWSRATDLNRYESRVLKAEGPRLAGSLIAGCSRATRVSKQAETPELEVIREVSASVAGPLLTGFVLWSLLEAQERGLDSLYFLARDGQVLTRVAEALVRRLGIPVEPRYLYASRQALFLPALDPEDEYFDDVCLRMVVGRTIPDVARSFELSEDALLDALPPELTPEGMGRRSFDDDRARQFVRFLRESELRAHVASLAEQRRVGMRSYFASQGLAGSGTIGLVDVGWKGTLQFFMANALKLATPHSPRRITGFYFGLGRVPPSLAGEAHVFLSDGMSFSASLIELFCAADHGSTWAYSEYGPGYMLQSEVNDAACEWGLAAQQEAIVEFAERLADIASGARLDLRELSETLQSTSVAAFTRFRRNPTRSEAEVYGPFQHSKDAVHDRYAELGPRSSLVGALASLFPIVPKRLRFIPRQRVLWPQATFMRSCSQAGLHQLAGGVLLVRSGLARFRRY